MCYLYKHCFRCLFQLWVELVNASSNPKSVNSNSPLSNMKNQWQVVFLLVFSLNQSVFSQSVVNQSIDSFIQSSNQSINQSINRSINQFAQTTVTINDNAKWGANCVLTALRTSYQKWQQMTKCDSNVRGQFSRITVSYEKCFAWIRILVYHLS